MSSLQASGLPTGMQDNTRVGRRKRGKCHMVVHVFCGTWRRMLALIAVRGQCTHHLCLQHMARCLQKQSACCAQAHCAARAVRTLRRSSIASAMSAQLMLLAMTWRRPQSRWRHSHGVAAAGTETLLQMTCVA